MQGLDFGQILITFAIIILSLTVHEAAHAWSAQLLGDNTARLLGRVSLNPAVHVDPIGTILFPLLAMATRAPLLGWAKPVPVNTLQLGANWKQKFMAIAAAGPASNLVLAALGAVALRVVLDPGGQPPDAPVVGILERFVELNVLLAVFNMLPLPPLDGGNVLAGLLRGKVATMFDNLRPYGFIILYGLMFSGMLFKLVQPPRDAITRLLAIIVNG